MSYDLNDYTRRNPATSKDSHLAGITSPSTLYTIQQSDTAGWQRQDEYFTRRDEDTPTSAPENDPYHRESYGLESSSWNGPYYGSRFMGTSGLSQDTGLYPSREPTIPDWQSASNGMVFGADEPYAIEQPMLPPRESMLASRDLMLDPRDPFGMEPMDFSVADEPPPWSAFSEHSDRTTRSTLANWLNGSPNITTHHGPSFPETDDLSILSVTPNYQLRSPTLNIAASDTSECSSAAEESAEEESAEKIVCCPEKACDAKFSGRYRKGNAARHRRLAHGGGRTVYTCEDHRCGRVFKRRDARLKHYRKHHPELAAPFVPRSRGDWIQNDYHSDGRSAYPCVEPSCQHVFQRQDARLKHVRKHHPQLAASLAYRPRGGWNQNDYRSGSDTREARDAMHEVFSPAPSPQLTHADPGKGHVDTVSSITMATASGSRSAVALENGESVQCDICQKEFNRTAEMRRHKDSVHNLNPPQYFCEEPGCERASRPFPRKDKLADHTARVHNQPTASAAFAYGKAAPKVTYPCDYSGCERVFERRVDLSRHQRTHLDPSDRPHKCTQCKQSFLYPKDLIRHKATHLDNEDDDKPSFHCEVASCDYGPGKQGFSRKDGMIRHMRRFHPDVIVKKEEV
jgi:uncharacterized Zn-finger protein